jgi:hypothetical protein
MFQVFDDVDEMFEAIGKGVDAAKARATPKQNAITYGDYWVRVWEDILIAGHITPQEELWATEAELGASEEELEWEMASMKANYDNGFRFGRAYSVIEPNGELGDTHVSEMVPITEEEFKQLKGLHWIFEEAMKLPWFNEEDMFSRV